jgi:hypothetical protein
MSDLQALSRAYIQGQAHSADILGDFLEEYGLPRIVQDQRRDRRFDILIKYFFVDWDRLKIACSLVEHVIPVFQAIDSAAELQLAIDTVRKLPDRSETELGDIAMLCWSKCSDAPPNTLQSYHVAWAAWALARRAPIPAIRSARLARDTEFNWQVDTVLEAISQQRNLL